MTPVALTCFATASRRKRARNSRRADDWYSSRASLRTAPAATTTSTRECQSARIVAWRRFCSALAHGTVSEQAGRPRRPARHRCRLCGAGVVGENSQEVLVEHFGRRGRDRVVERRRRAPLGRRRAPRGPLFCFIYGLMCGRAWPPSAAGLALRRRAARAGVRRRSLPHELRHAYVIELGREGVPLNVIQPRARSLQPRRDVDLPVPSSAASASRPSAPDGHP